jgi:hypothetical protein
MSKIEAHELILKLKDMAIELGRTPHRDEFIKQIVNGKRAVTDCFGSYAALVIASGLQGTRTKKVDNSIFEFKIERHLEQYREKPQYEPVLQRKKYPKIAVLGDIHEPFSHEKLKADFVSFVGLQQPDYVIQVGDSFDAYAHAKFPRSHNVFTPKEEEQIARKNMEILWSEIHRVSPNSKCVMLLGNHCIRSLKRVLESVPSIEHWAAAYLKDLMTFDGVETIYDPTQEYFIEDIAFLHGYRSQIGEHRDYMLMNAVCGHIHLGGVSYRHIQGKTLWELNAGLAGDPLAKGLSYRPQKIFKWTLGWGFIDQWGPRFIPY